MLTVNMHEAKTQFSKLIARVQAGEEIIIARDGRDRNIFSVAEDFDAPLPENILAEFES